LHRDQLEAIPANGESYENAENNCLEIFKLLENSGANINYIDAGGNNVTIEAATFHNTKILQYLLEKKDLM
jgi:ankyrin repeat protein